MPLALLISLDQPPFPCLPYPFLENVSYIEVQLSTGKEVHSLVFLLDPINFLMHSQVFQQVAFVSYHHQHELLLIFLLHQFHPVLEIENALLVAHVINKNDHDRILVIKTANAAKALLPRGVSEGDAEGAVGETDVFEEMHGAVGGRVGVLEDLVDVHVDETSFADMAVAYQHHLELVVHHIIKLSVTFNLILFIK